MAKKRKNAATKASLSTANGNSSKGTPKKTATIASTSGGDSTNKISSIASHMSGTKSPFHSFPTHLVSKKYTISPTVVGALNLKELYPGFVWVIPNFFSPTECQNWIHFSESCSNGFEYTSHPASNYIAQRECYRMQQSNATDLAGIMYERMEKGGILQKLHRELAPLRFPDGYRPLGFNPNLRLYKYVKGHAFGKHVDGSNLVESMGMTEITVLIYLSSCKGGATRFYPPTSRRKQSSFAFDPEPGTMLLHVHGDRCLEHEADQVLDGIKYVLRTDVVFNTI